MKKVPATLWAVVDLDPNESDGDGVLGWFTTRKEAREKCARFNTLPGYVPSCCVAKYTLAAPVSRKDGEP